MGNKGLRLGSLFKTMTIPKAKVAKLDVKLNLYIVFEEQNLIMLFKYL